MILLVDDDADLLKTLCRRLELRDFECLGAANMESAEALLNQDSRIGFVLADLGVWRWESPSSRTVPIAIMTGHLPESPALKILDGKDVAALLHKPIELNDLIRVLADAGITPKKP